MMNRLFDRLGMCWRLMQRKRFDSKHLPLPKILQFCSSHSSPPKVLLLGDSVSERVSRHDRDARPMWQMVESNLGTSVYSMTHSAYNLKLYYLIVQAFVSLGIKPTQILLPINLRSFSPQWYLNPLFQCDAHIQNLLQFLLPRKLDGGPELFLPNNSITAFLNARIDIPGLNYKTVAMFQQIINSTPESQENIIERKRNLFRFHYMNPVRPDHPLLGVLRGFSGYVTKLGIQTIYYLTPINHVSGYKHVGQDFLEIVNSNARIIAANVGKSSSNLFDFSLSLTPDFFFNQDETTEHLNERGRLWLADNICKALNGARRYNG